VADIEQPHPAPSSATAGASPGASPKVERPAAPPLTDEELDALLTDILSAPAPLQQLRVPARVTDSELAVCRDSELAVIMAEIVQPPTGTI
jgi:hypothetical protein